MTRCILAIVFYWSVVCANGATWPAASVHQQAVQTAINQASAGDTVTIPAGSTNWTSTPPVSTGVGITLQGAGTNSTIITFTTPNSNGYDSLAGIIINGGGGYSQIYGITFKGGSVANSTAAPAIAAYGAVLRVSNCHFENCRTPFHIYGPFGVCDHCTFRNNTGTIHTYSKDAGNSNWQNFSNDPFTSTNYFFYEDCTFRYDSSYNGMLGAFGLFGGGQGGLYVVRKCSLDTRGSTAEVAPFADWHGDNNDGTRSAVSTQIYQNNITTGSGSQVDTLSQERGGKALIYSNIVDTTAGGSVGGSAAFEEFPLGTQSGGMTVFDYVTNTWNWANTLNGSASSALNIVCGPNCQYTSFHNSPYTNSFAQPYPHPLVNGTTPTPGTLRLFGDSGSIVEDQGSFTVVFIRTNGVDGAVSLHYTTSDGTAMAGVNYVPATGTISWANQDGANKTLDIPILNTGMAVNKTFTITVSNPTGGATLGSPNSTVITIVGTAAGETFTWSSSVSSTNASGILNLPVIRGNGAAGTVHVDYATQDITAHSGVDYTATSGTLSFPPGVMSSNVPVTITYQSATTNRTFMVILSNPIAGTELVDPTTNTVTIVGTGGSFNPGQLRIGNINVNVSETVGSITGIVRRINGVDGTASCSFSTRDGSAIAGINYVATNGTINFMNGDALNKNVSIIINNTGFVGVKTFTFYITNVSGATPVSPTVTTVSIAGTGTQTVSYENPTSAAGTSGVLTNWVVRQHGTGGAVSVDYATHDGSAMAGQDYVATNGTLNFANGVSSNQVRVNITYQSPTTNRAFTIALSNPAGISIASPGTNTVTEVAFTPPIQTLSVMATNNSINPLITANVVDTNGMSSGHPTFTLYYTNNPIVTLTAPATLSATNVFSNWLVDGSSTTPNTSVAVSMAVSHQVTAVYKFIPPPPVIRLLTLTSSPFTGAFLSASPTDKNGAVGGITPFTLSYTNNESISLFASAVPGFEFRQWLLDGFANTTNAIISFIMGSNRSVVAIYTSTAPPRQPLEINDATISNATILP